MHKWFWEMTKEEIDDIVGRYGLTAWKDKVAADRAEAPRVLAGEPNPWASETWDVRRQNVVSSLVPDLARRLRGAAGLDEEG